MSNLITGTIAQLAGKLEINGVVLGQPELSIMSRLLAGSAFRKIGEIRKEGARGRPNNVWEIDTEAMFNVSVCSASEVRTSDPVASNEESEVESSDSNFPALDDIPELEAHDISDIVFDDTLMAA